MTSLSRFFPVVLAGAVAFAVGCGGDPSGPTAASVTGIAGDSQVAPTGAPLVYPLSFVVLNSSGHPMPDVSVTWTVTPTGGATFAPAISTTDAQGTAATNVTLGGTLGDVVIRGNVPGLQPVVFHALAVDPCVYAAPYTLGATVSAALTTTDCNSSGWYYDFYGLSLPPGQHSLRISMASSTFDAYVDLYKSFGDLVAFDDDIQPGVIQNSQLDIILPSGSYVIGPNSYSPGATGPYTMSAVTRPATLGGCQLVWLVRGVTVTDAIAATDCADTAGGTDYFDPVAIWATVGTVLTINERSTEFDAKLRLLNGSGVLQTENDDSTTGNMNSFIAFTVPATGPYLVLIGTSGVGQTGAYTIDVSASTTLRASARAWRGAELLAFPPRRLPKAWKALPGRARSH